MQAISARPATFSAGAPPAAGGRPQRRRQQQRGAGLVAHADVGFCRDKVSERTDKMDEIEGTATVVFLGVNGTEVEVECPKVRRGLVRACGQHATSCFLCWRACRAIRLLLRLLCTGPCHLPSLNPCLPPCLPPCLRVATSLTWGWMRGWSCPSPAREASAAAAWAACRRVMWTKAT